MLGNDDTEKLLDATKKIKSLLPEKEVQEEEKTSISIEDWLIDSLTSLSSFFDDLYLLRSFGIISDNNILYNKLNKGDLGSKVWLVSLILSVRRSLTHLMKLIKLKWRLRKEDANIAHTYCPGFRKLLKERIAVEGDIIRSKIRSLFMDLIQDLLYMLIVMIDIFKVNLSKRLRSILEFISSAATVLKFVTTSYQVCS